MRAGSQTRRIRRLVNAPGRQAALRQRHFCLCLFSRNYVFVLPGASISRKRRNMQRYLECDLPRRFLMALVALVSIATGMAPPPAAAQGVAGFYRGNKIAFVGGPTPCGRYDAGAPAAS